MNTNERSNGCERCGRHEPVTYVHWMFLCGECRIELTREQEQEAQHARLMAELERTAVQEPRVTANRKPALRAP